jgi:hypothetical protein
MNKLHYGRIPYLKMICPLPILLEQLGMGAYAKASCKSPFRSDENPSWGIFNKCGNWFFKDHSTGEGGDEICFLAKHFKLDLKHQFSKIVTIYESIATSLAGLPCTKKEQPLHTDKPNRDAFFPGNSDQLKRLANLRGYDESVLRYLTNRELLIFGRYANTDVYGITDSSGRIIELRRLDGKLFPSFGSLPERKSHSVRHSQKAWPLGITEVDEACSMILLCEGVPDFIASWQIVIKEESLGRVVPVTVLGASNKISAEALPLFKNKTVRIVPHQDQAGIHAAQRWSEQLTNAGVHKVDFVNLGVFKTKQTSQIQDLDDFKKWHQINLNNKEWRILNDCNY